jgi:hypothetical protein
MLKREKKAEAAQVQSKTRPENVFDTRAPISDF